MKKKQYCFMDMAGNRGFKLIDLILANLQSSDQR